MYPLTTGCENDITENKIYDESSSDNFLPNQNSTMPGSEEPNIPSILNDSKTEHSDVHSEPVS